MKRAMALSAYGAGRRAGRARHPQPAPPTPAMRPWLGTFYVGCGWLLYCGPLGPTTLHHHRVVQWLRVVRGVFRICDRSGHALSCTSAVVPSNIPHASEGLTEHALLLYIDPDSSLGSRLTGASGSSRYCASAWCRAGRVLRMVGPGDVDGWPSAQSFVMRLLHSNDCLRRASGPTHPAVQLALRLLPDLLEAPIRVPDLARAAGLSTSRFSHVFNEQVGMSLRAYVLWLRLQQAARALERGLTLTEAAHTAGFADSAHLSRTFRSTFGLSPSMALGQARWVTDPADQIGSGFVQAWPNTSR